MPGGGSLFNIPPGSGHSLASGIRGLSSIVIPSSAAVIASGNQYRADILQAEAALQANDPDGAIRAFQQAQTVEPDDGQALDGLARAYTAKNQPAQALAMYRALFYHAPGRRWTSSLEGEPTTLMRFALLLDRAGQTPEALTAYHRAVGILNYDAGKPRHEVLLPDLGGAPGQEPYTPQMLEAMAHLAIGMEAPGFDVSELRQAVKLAPDSAAANFYLGKCLYAKQGSGSQEAKAALQKAIHLGDDRTAQAAQVYLQFIH